MNPGICGFFDEPDWIDETEYQHYCNVVVTDDGVCFMDDEQFRGDHWIESNHMVPLEDMR